MRQHNNKVLRVWVLRNKIPDKDSRARERNGGMRSSGYHGCPGNVCKSTTGKDLFNPIRCSHTTLREMEIH